MDNESNDDLSAEVEQIISTIASQSAQLIENLDAVKELNNRLRVENRRMRAALVDAIIQMESVCGDCAEWMDVEQQTLALAHPVYPTEETQDV
jgi:regulator of replication initiation timing